MMRDTRSHLWTYGAEHEWADWPINAVLPAGCVRNKKDHTIANSSGIANDPAGKSCRVGGEINTPPTSSILEQVEILRALRRALPTASVNYRSNLHIHISPPGLRHNLAALKQVQRYIHEHMPRALDIIAPLPRPSCWDFRRDDELRGATRRWKRCLVSHRTFLPPARLAQQMRADNVDSFFAAEVPQSKNRPLWHLQPRACVNLRQLLDTNTIEFRHFPGTLDEVELLVCFEWCSYFLDAALHNKPIEPLLNWARKQPFPRFAQYNHWIDVRFQATIRDGSIPLDSVKKNIKAIEDGTFAESTAPRPRR